MQLRRELHVAEWDGRVADACAVYLRERGFRGAEVLLSKGYPVVSGKRGSWWGNFTSFDMRKLRATIVVYPTTFSRVGVDLDINTLGQDITEWNVAFWRLELIELHRVLNGWSRIDDVWERFSKERRTAAVEWSVTATLGGQRLTPAWDAEIRALENAQGAQST